MKNSEETPKKPNRSEFSIRPQDRPFAAYVYKFGFFILLATTIASTVMLNRLLKANERLNDGCGKLQANSEKLLGLSTGCIAQRDRCLDDFRKLDQSTGKLQGLLDSCIEEMNGSTDSTQETINSLQSLTACEQRLTHITKQHRLETAKLVSDVEWCTEEKTKLQKQLLQPCPGM